MARIVKKDGLNLRQRTLKYAARIVRRYTALPKTTEAQVIGKQILRSGTSVGAHVAEADRAKSVPDFISKLQGALGELEETRYWIELIIELGIMKATRLRPLLNETDELSSILVVMISRSRRKSKS